MIAEQRYRISQLKVKFHNFSMKITKIGSHKNNLLYMQLSTNTLVFCNHWTGGLSSLYV